MARSEKATAGGIVGMLTFAVGIILLVISFALTYSLFSQLGDERAELFHNLPQEPKMLAGTVLSWVLRLLFRLTCLLIMGFIASLIAARGAQMYSASKSSGSQKLQE